METHANLCEKKNPGKKSEDRFEDTIKMYTA